jgi:hypothetical protein
MATKRKEDQTDSRDAATWSLAAVIVAITIGSALLLYEIIDHATR